MFELLVIIGVAGELIADGGVFVFSRRLQAISDSEIAELDKKILRSNSELVAAYNLASGAWSNVRDLIDQATKLKTQNPSWELTLEQQLTFAESCRAFSGARVKILHLTRDTDSGRLARQIQAALEYAHIAVINESAAQLKGVAPGVTIIKSAAQRGLAQAITVSLITSGIPTTSKLDEVGDIELRVGARPLTLLAPNASSKLIKMK